MLSCRALTSSCEASSSGVIVVGAIDVVVDSIVVIAIADVVIFAVLMPWTLRHGVCDYGEPRQTVSCKESNNTTTPIIQRSDAESAVHDCKMQAAGVYCTVVHGEEGR